jgi:hypothetical protein
MERSSMRFWICLCLVLLDPLTSGTAFVHASDGWSWIHPLPDGHYLHAVATCGGRTIAVGTGGLMLTTIDGQTWSEIDSGTESTLRDITCTDTGWIAVGSSGTVLTSTDGSSWSVGSTGTDTALYIVGWDGLYVTAGYPAAVFTSDDGVAWTQRYSSSDIEDLFGFASNGSKLVISGEWFDIWDGTFQPMLVSSDDRGKTWTRRIFWGLNGAFRRAAYGGSGFAVACLNEGRIAMSTDGDSWTFKDPGIWPMGITWTGTRYVAAGYDGMVAASVDGETWTSQQVGMETQLRDVEGDDDLLVAVGRGGGIAISNDGSGTWQPIVSATAVLDRRIEDLATDGKTIVAVGYGMPTYVWSLLTRDASGTWTEQADFPIDPEAVAWGNGLYVAVGSGASYALVSADGLSWSNVPHPSSTELHGVVWTGTRFIAVGDSGTVHTSPDGLSWSEAPTTVGANGTMRSVTCRADRCVAVGTGCRAMISEDGGLSWPILSDLIGDCSRVRGVADTGSSFVAVGYPNKIYTSPDGLEWIEQVSGASGSLWDIAWIGGRLVAVGYGGALESPDGLSWSPLDIGTKASFYAADSASRMIGSFWGDILEYTELFTDGFESGDTSVWSSAVP